MEKKNNTTCPYCNSDDYTIMNDSSVGYIGAGLIIFFIFLALGIPQVSIITMLAVIFTAISNALGKNTLKLKCNKCNQKYKVDRSELKK